MTYRFWASRRLAEFHSTSWSLRGRYLSRKCLHLLNLGCAIHLTAEYIGRPSFMSGPSMLPTFAHEGEVVIENRLSYRLFPERLSRGDLVVLQSPIEPGHIICKRIIGMPGDIVCVDPTGVWAPSTEHVKIPKGHVWISGDNAAYSRDSREYGPVSMSLIQGTLFARIWPLHRATIFRNPMTFLD
ncbi:Mitochondrial inner membrane protease subunit 1 [Hypsizygus marmoreus]|uniref:Mitochondrial inner membrane protease subunit 1 n=1 Tax=Hypsizygus marmoreus TaxID=39966 RepID=A0A369K4G9_HYPMA|nr:Mitochondrial inner membrane protease subunit 1 [Hypsizygus marmoreus]